MSKKEVIINKKNYDKNFRINTVNYSIIDSNGIVSKEVKDEPIANNKLLHDPRMKEGAKCTLVFDNKEIVNVIF